MESLVHSRFKYILSFISRVAFTIHIFSWKEAKTKRKTRYTPLNSTLFCVEFTDMHRRCNINFSTYFRKSVFIHSLGICLGSGKGSPGGHENIFIGFFVKNYLKTINKQFILFFKHFFDYFLIENNLIAPAVHKIQTEKYI